MRERIKRVDVLAQEIRHGLAEALWADVKNDDPVDIEKTIKSKLTRGLKELHQS
jgi:hypothetical protein